jgi:hypothetical protein
MDEYVDVYREACRLASELGEGYSNDGSCMHCAFFDEDELPLCMLKNRYTSPTWKCKHFEEA